MGREKGGFGFVILLVVLAVVMVMAAQAWKKWAPVAVDLDAAAPISDHGETEANEALRSGQLPRMKEVRERTDAHADDVQEALASIE